MVVDLNENKLRFIFNLFWCKRLRQTSCLICGKVNVQNQVADHCAVACGLPVSLPPSCDLLVIAMTLHQAKLVPKSVRVGGGGVGATSETQLVFVELPLKVYKIC